MKQRLKCPKCSGKIYDILKEGPKVDIACHGCGNVMLGFTEKPREQAVIPPEAMP